MSKFRLGCSDLNSDKVERHISETSNCSCGHPYEDKTHYFFLCPQYTHIRQNQYFYTNRLSVEELLYGSDKLSVSETTLSLESLQDFITKSKRFDFKA